MSLEQCDSNKWYKPAATEGNLSFYWGYKGPGNVGNDNFCAEFKQKVAANGSDYYIRTFADDGVKVSYNGENVINRWSPSSGEFSTANLLKLSGEKEITTTYFEKTGRAILYSHIAPFGQWVGYYYNNDELKGKPINSKVLPDQGGKLHEDVGRNSPIPTSKAYAEAINEDHYSAQYFTTMRLNAGKYIVRAKADDGIKVLIDGKEVVDRWTASSYREDAVKIQIDDSSKGNIHEVEVQYFEKTGKAKVDVEILPFNEENQLSTDSWYAEYYSNTNLSGNAYVEGGKDSLNGIKDLSLDWGYDSPHRNMNTNDFSASFKKKVNLSKDSYYELNAWADDGVRVFIDDKKVIDSWIKSSGDLRQSKELLTAGEHTITVQYLERGGRANIKFKMNELPTYSQKVTDVHHNWGSGSPSGLPNDHFYGYFDQSTSFKGGDYFIQTFADDGVKVQLDGQSIINRWSDNSGKVDRKLLRNLSPGTHRVETHYYENTGAAAVFSDIVPFDHWLAYYYPNKEFKGRPLNAKIIAPKENGNLVDSPLSGSPAANIPNDNYTAKYVTAKKLPAGDYLVKALADDGVQVYVDGKLVLDRLTTSSYREDAVKVTLSDTAEGNVHWIEVRYLEATGTAKLDVSVTPYGEDLIPSYGWVAEYYPTIINPNQKPDTSISSRNLPNVMGTQGSVNEIPVVDFYWKDGSPHRNIPNDNFSGIIKGYIHIDESGKYDFEVKADDGVIVEIGDQRIIDSWSTSNNGLREAKEYHLERGTHLVTIKYFEKSGNASLKFDYKKTVPVISKTYEETNYNMSFDEFLQTQMAVYPQTDKKYDSYIREDGIDEDNKVLIDGFNVRGGPSTSYWSIGTLRLGETVKILSTTEKDGNGYKWHKIEFNQMFVNASPEDTAYYLNPNNFEREEAAYLQFLILSRSAGLDVTEVNRNILENQGILAGKAATFIQAAEQYSVNEVYLIAHALLETGNGTSPLGTGIKVSTVDGKAVEPKVTYNMYGYGANDHCAEKCGSEFAYKQGWFTPEAAIIGGAELIARDYISKGQDTLYKMRWNPENPGTHQYATDIGWAYKQVSKIYELYALLASYKMTFDVPVFTNQPPKTEAVDSDYTGYSSAKAGTTSDRVNFRKEPYVSSSTLIKTLNEGQSLKVLGLNSDGWYKVVVDGTKGWLHSDYVTIK
ncbi:PA14 domain-containing protein [Rossellomorea vietnamensis]|uniref:PA14 domain-containing protein n=1 Tax=Rossellomorea vietnamensis TaxID=218284 RepID=UPI001E4A7FC2|nr:PA14 domain-containing protein [Rossellomorea vietnamensis]MCC5803164.1 SH3 domain-containing protein [Rossellomorea vietnamensis]